ncbi:MAG: 23S rRNA (guanosine(2251)-2'-O)-methyltransferase RlmB [Mariprofundaceae bacterium]
MSTLAGIHAVKHALEAGEAIDELLIEKGKKHPRINELIHLAKKVKVRVTFTPKEVLDRLSEGASHQGVVARAGAQQKLRFEDWLAALDMSSAPLILLLDQVTDPHNLGACIRTAGAAGCAGVVVPKDNTADIHSPVVAKSACGALSRLPVLVVTNLVRSMKQIQDKGFWLIGLAGEAEQSLYHLDLHGATGLVMGAEDKGLRRLVRETCDQLTHIPMPGMMESLNVSVATGVALFEAVRQKKDRI